MNINNNEVKTFILEKPKIQNNNFLCMSQLHIIGVEHSV